jgi:hypothetical protein
LLVLRCVVEEEVEVVEVVEVNGWFEGLSEGKLVVDSEEVQETYDAGDGCAV